MCEDWSWQDLVPDRSSDGEAAPTGSAAARTLGPGLRRSHPAMAKPEEGRVCGQSADDLGDVMS